jgi:hypothetical protein
MLIKNFLFCHLAFDVSYYVSEVTSAGGDATIERSVPCGVWGTHLPLCSN